MFFLHVVIRANDYLTIWHASQNFQGTAPCRCLSLDILMSNIMTAKTANQRLPRKCIMTVCFAERSSFFQNPSRPLKKNTPEHCIWLLQRLILWGLNSIHWESLLKGFAPDKKRRMCLETWEKRACNLPFSKKRTNCFLNYPFSENSHQFLEVG